MKTPLPLLLLSAACLAIGAPTQAQAQAPALPDKAAFKAQLDAREKRADLLLAELRSTDDRIEATVDRVIETLKWMGDSTDSKTKMTRLKEQTITALQKNIAFYQQKRASLQEEMRRPTLHLTPDEKQRAIAKFDARIEKRVQQVLALTNSLPRHQDHDRYKVVSDGGWGWGPTYAPNEDYKQNQRLTAHSNTQRSQIMRELQRSLDRIDRQIRTLQSQFVAASTEPSRKMLMDELSKYEGLKRMRQEQLSEVSTSPELTTRPLGNKEAQDVDASLRRVADSLRRDFTALFQRYSAYITERSNVNAAKASLAAMK
ncbi:hypothetical protein AYO49_02825 [Verrucomicrobiaceae bacterium SCGC AG-212-N21]|nr:hypothetical protein AYO49_02825 [Verrucomicrobiaceae bacterium SCGC AG-212-N21]